MLCHSGFALEQVVNANSELSREIRIVSFNHNIVCHSQLDRIDGDETRDITHKQ